MSAALTAEQLVDIVVNRYFAKVDAKDLAGTLSCFNPDIHFTIQSSFTDYYGRDDAEKGIKGMFERLSSSYKTIWHGNFSHIVDVPNQSIASQFNVRLVDDAGHETNLSNCNFFYLKNGLFQRVFVYMSGDNVLR